MSDKMREEFEAWAKRHHGAYSTGSVYGHYSNEKVNQDWFIWCIAWQASRAALVVELPEAVYMYNEYTGDYCETYDCDEVKDALTKAGVKYNDEFSGHKGVSHQTQPKPLVSAQETSNKYIRQIAGLDGKTCQIDVYRVLAAFEVDSHPVAHAIKKLLAPGMRHAKTREQDLKEAIASIEAELLMMEQAE